MESKLYGVYIYIYIYKIQNVGDILIAKLLDALITNYELAVRQIKQSTWKVIWSSSERNEENRL